jgi:hypothetical protein
MLLAMRHLGIAAFVVAMGIAGAACGGPSKPPLLPDQDDSALGSDGGVDTPGTGAPAPGTPAQPKK